MGGRDVAGERGAIRTGLGVSGVLFVVELVGGWLTNSLALLSDAVHMFTDLAALGLALFAIWICSRPASATKSYGYYRAEILVALVNGVALWVLVLFILREAWGRFGDPQPVEGGGMLAIALAGLAVNAYVAWGLHEHRHHSMNVRGAYLHVISDMLGSVGAVIAGIVIVTTGWYAVDALVSVGIAILILHGSWQLVREAVDVLMEAVPSHVALDAVEAGLAAVPGVAEIHDLHVWTLTTGRYALSVHAVASERVADDSLLAALSDVCRRDFSIDHVTIQIEHESRRAHEPEH